MLTKKNIGPFLFWTAGLISIPLWVLSSPETTFRHNIEPFFIYGSQILSHAGFALFSLSFVLSCRSGFLEDLFGGQDKMYHTHHRMGIAAFVLLVAHPVFIALRWVPEDITKSLWYIFPLHRRLEVDLGSYALMGLIILMLLTLTRKIPYDKWKLTHKLMGIFLVLGTLHVFLLSKNVISYFPLLIYTVIISGAGISSYIYKTVLFGYLVKKYRYKVFGIRKHSGNIMEITLSPLGENVDFTPGQYCFFSFRSPHLSRESHPYTICSAEGDRELSVLVKALGDYTTQLYNKLEKGTEALLEGPYGRFDFSRGSESQIWIGGGVGIAPFVSWVRDLCKHPKNNLKITIYYCVNTKDEAIHLKEFKEAEKRLDNFRVQLVAAECEGFLNPFDIPEVIGNEIFLCGPSEMRKTMVRGFLDIGVPQERIHYEDFDFK